MMMTMLSWMKGMSQAVPVFLIMAVVVLVMTSTASSNNNTLFVTAFQLQLTTRAATTATTSSSMWHTPRPRTTTSTTETVIQGRTAVLLSAVSSHNQQSLMDRVTTATTVASEATTSASKSVNFPQTWVPMGSVYELDGTKPNSVYFFGQEYIIYQNTQAALTGTNQGNQGWCVMDSTCPHRLAPLREGRIIPETQQIQCSYHGWTFDGTNHGECTSIPQLPVEVDSQHHSDDNPVKTQRILSNPKCSVTTYPCMVEKNILWAWLWPNSDENGNPNNDHALTYTHLPEYYLDHVPLNATATFTRIVPYSYDILIENIMDISHVPFAHHTLQGTRNDADIVKPVVNTTIEYLSVKGNNRTETELSFADGFRYQFIDQTRKQTRDGTCTFKAPYMVHYDATLVETKKPFALTTLLIPVSAGYSKIIIFSAFGSTNQMNSTTTTKETKNSIGIDTKDTAIVSTSNNIDGGTAVVPTDKENDDVVVVAEATSTQRRSLVQQFIFYIILPRLPIWFLHTFSNRFLDSDLMLLHDQEINLQSRRQRRTRSQSLHDQDSNIVDGTDTSKSILEQYFMPSKADRSIVTIRKWISQYASAVYDLSPPPPLSESRSPVVPPYKDRTLLFDRYNQHSKNCRHCNTMLETSLPKYRTYSYTLLSISIMLWNRHVLFRLLSIGCILSFRVYNWIDHTLRHGDFDHSKNH